MKKPVDAVEHVLVLDELASISLLDASLHTRDEARLIFEHTGDGVSHKLLGVLATGGGDLLEKRFDVGREMYFHALHVTIDRETTA